MKKEFLTYDSITLATEDDFIAWVKHHKNHKAWETFCSDHPDFEKIVNEARAIVNKIELKTYSLSSQKKDDIWEKIDQEIQEDVTTPSNSKVIRMALTVASIAAVFLLIWMISGGDTMTIIKSERGSSLLASLPDQSSIRLNAKSIVQYNEDTYANDRTLLMDGEVFFEVEEGQKFTVKMDNGQVDVLGTSFNIYHRNDSLAVQCYTGKVRVTIDENINILTPGQSITYSAKEGKMRTPTFALESQEPSWTKGRFNYDRAPLALIIAEMERQFDKKFVFKQDSLKNMTLRNGGFTNDNIQSALEEILWPLNLKFTIYKDQVEIYR